MEVHWYSIKIFAEWYVSYEQTRELQYYIRTVLETSFKGGYQAY